MMIAQAQMTLDQIKRRAAEVAHAAPVTVSAEAYEGVRVGQIFARQGDLYFTKLERVPAGAQPWTLPHGQLVQGTTQGSRHTVDLSQVRLWALPHASELDGPVIEAPAGVVIHHPEHGAHVYNFPCIVQVTYQRQYADELRRVQD